ncbi:hypothetical protein GcC1_023046, partial [Golovinomyces cichoracearum]
MYLKELIIPNISSNQAGYLDGGAGLRYRDIENSNWRTPIQEKELLNERPETHRRKSRDREDEEEEMTFEQFSGEKIRNVGNNHTR